MKILFQARSKKYEENSFEGQRSNKSYKYTAENHPFTNSILQTIIPALPKSDKSTSTGDSFLFHKEEVIINKFAAAN